MHITLWREYLIHLSILAKITHFLLFLIVFLICFLPYTTFKPIKSSKYLYINCINLLVFICFYFFIFIIKYIFFILTHFHVSFLFNTLFFHGCLIFLIFLQKAKDRKHSCHNCDYEESYEESFKKMKRSCLVYNDHKDEDKDDVKKMNFDEVHIPELTHKRCNICGKTFSSGKALGGHRRSHFQASKKKHHSQNVRTTFFRYKVLELVL